MPGRLLLLQMTSAIASVDNGTSISEDPSAILDYKIDWSAWLTAVTDSDQHFYLDGANRLTKDSDTHTHHCYHDLAVGERGSVLRPGE